MKIKTRLSFILTLLIVSCLSILPCFAQSAASIQLKKPEYYKPDRLWLGAAVFSPGLQTIAGVSIHTVIFWNVSSGEVIRSLRHAVSPPMAFSPGGHTLVVGRHENRIVVWDASKGETFHEEIGKGSYQVNSMAFSSDGRTVANGCQRNGESSAFVRLWDVSTGTTLHMLEHPEFAVSSVTFSPDGGTLASMATWGIIRLWDVSTGELIREIDGLSTAGSLIFSPDGGTIASLTNSIRLWDVSTGERVGQIYGENVHITNAAFSPCGGMIANVQHYVAYSRPHTIMRVWDVSTGEHLRTLEAPTSNATTATNIVTIAFSPDGGTLASVDDHGRVLLWDMDPCEPERVPEDVNGDGVVNIQDLVAVAAALGETGETPADVNGDGTVNIQDLVAVAAALGETAANAPSAANLSAETVQQWLTAANQLNLTDATSQRGIRILEQLLLTLTPKETALLANYPNPFNPETWIPYHLASPADVTLRIHAVDGTLVRTLSLGYKAIGTYQSRSRAAYWDGKNQLGEPVASGVYFYTLTAGDFTATRKMLIRK